MSREQTRADAGGTSPAVLSSRSLRLTTIALRTLYEAERARQDRAKRKTMDRSLTPSSKSCSPGLARPNRTPKPSPDSQPASARAMTASQQTSSRTLSAPTLAEAAALPPFSASAPPRPSNLTATAAPTNATESDPDFPSLGVQKVVWAEEHVPQVQGGQRRGASGSGEGAGAAPGGSRFGGLGT